jgi:hypothetical protein
MAFYTHDVANFHSSSFGSIKLNGRESLEALAYWGKYLRLCAAVEYFLCRNATTAANLKAL